jgi:ABC-type sulfate transport system substrate-binding protein
VAVYESTAIEQIENAAGRYGELHVYYPPATVLSDHPFCILAASWVQPEQAQAARQFVDYLAARPAQELALLKYGFRPADAGVPLDQPGSPFTRYSSNGFSTALPPQVAVPSGDVLSTLLDFWSRSVRR